MDIIFVISIICLFVGCKFFPSGNNPNSFSFEQTNSINGFFVLLIFIRHFYQYIEPDKLDYFSSMIDLGLRQLIVVSFMFFSGYAIMLNIEKHKKDEYIKKIPLKCLQLWVKFVCAILLYIFVGYLMGDIYDYKTILLAFLGLRSIGNSTWYCVAIICLWLFTYISFGFFRGKMRYIIFAALMLVYSLVFALIKTETWYNTIVCFFLGILYFRFEPKINKKKHRCFIMVGVLVSTILLISFGLYCFINYFLFYELGVVSFTVLLIVFSSYFKIKNSVLMFLGKYSFEIYILQRLPMIIFEKVIRNHLLFFMVSFGITLVISLAYRYIFNNSIKKLFVKFSLRRL